MERATTRAGARPSRRAQAIERQTRAARHLETEPDCRVALALGAASDRIHTQARPPVREPQPAVLAQCAYLSVPVEGNSAFRWPQRPRHETERQPRRGGMPRVSRQALRPGTVRFF